MQKITLPIDAITAPATRNWFSDTELHCHCDECKALRANGDALGFNHDQVDPTFLAHLNRVREFWYCQAMPLSSGFRCLAHPIEAKKVRAAQAKDQPFVPGDHPSGVGVDVRVAGAQAFYLEQALHVYNWAHQMAGLDLPFTAISAHQRGGWGGRFVHIGGNPAATGRPRPYSWTY